MILRVIAIVVAVLLLVVVGWWIFGPSRHGEVGQISTNFRWLGPNDRIVVDGFDDPKIGGVACHISRAQRGGVSGGLGFSEDTSDASIACRQIGPISFREPIRDGEKVFNEGRSLIFKTLQVVRFYDAKRRVLVYVAYSDRVMTGSPQNSISSVPLMPWGTIEPTNVPADGG